MKKSIALILSILLTVSIAFSSIAATVAIKGVSLNKTQVSVKENESFALKVTFKPSNTTQKKLTFKSDNAQIASVDSKGIITGEKAGVTTINVTTEDKKISAKCKVTVVAGDKITFRFAWWGGDSRHVPTLQAFDQYNKMNPNVEIIGEYGGYGDYLTKLKTQLAGGTAPDFIQITSPWLPELAGFGGGHPFADLYKFDFMDLSGFTQSLLKDYAETDGKLVGMPAGANAFTMIYNKNFLAKFKISANTKWTWDKILLTGRSVHSKDKDSYLLNTDINTLGGYVVKPYVTQKTGGNWINNDYTLGFDKATLTEALTYLKKLFDYGVMQPFGEASLYNGKPDQNPKWINGQIGMNLNWASTVPTYKASAGARNIGVMGYPIMNNAKQTAVLVQPSCLIAMNYYSKNQRAGAKFLNWFINDPTAIKILKDCRSIPMSSKATEILKDNFMVDNEIAQAMTIGSKKPGKPTTALSNNGEIGAIENDAYAQMVFGKITPEQAADTIIKGFTAKLQELKSNSK